MKARRTSQATCWFAGVAGAALLSGCGEPDFQPPSHVDGVRILATRADRPYPAPGDAVNLEVLAVDGREEPATPMKVYWVPSPCIDPPGDAFYACFPAFERRFRRGVDAASKLTEGTTFSFSMPGDVIASRASAGEEAPSYGLAVVFTIACAGEVRYLGPGDTADAVPFGCFGAAGARLGPHDFVFAYSLLYAHDEQTNENPVVDRVTVEGEALARDDSLQLPRCERKHIDDCKAVALDLDLPDSTQEVDPTNRDADGHPLKEQLYAQYFATGGKFEHDTVLLFDPRSGRLKHTENDFRAPREAGDYRLWIVVHDDRGGVSWGERRLEVR